MTEQMPHILLVEDDVVDAEAVIRAFKKSELTYPVIAVSNGIEALQRLRGNGSVLPVRQPFIVLLDLNMPQMNGIEFLQELRRDQDLKRSIVFILTTSNRPEDMVAAYNYQVAGYFLKSAMADNFDHIATLIRSYCDVIEFPPT